MINLVTFNFNVSAELEKDLDVGGFTAYCSALQLCGQGNSKDEAMKDLRTVIHLFVEECVSMGTIFQVLKDCGFSVAVDQQKNITGNGSIEDSNAIQLQVEIPYGAQLANV